MHRHHIHKLHSFYRSSTQRGAVLVQFALLAGVLVGILGGVQIGYMYFAKRDLQRTADLAALEAVNALTYGDDSTCTSRAKPAAEQSITSNLRVSLESETRSIECGHWNAGKADDARFNISTSKNNPLNSARIQLRGEALKLLPFTGSRVVAASAIAAKNNESVASFSIGSQLLQFNNDSLLGHITAAVGLDISKLTVLDKNGVANAKITPSGLLQFLGLPIGVEDLALLTPNDLANVEASILDLIDAAINAGSDSLLNAGVDIASLIDLRAYLAALKIADLKIPLGGERGLLAMISGGGGASPIGAGLDVVIDLADLVRTQLAIANGTNSVALSLGVPGLVTADLTVVEPPKLAIGPADGNTKARSAQVRLGINLGGSENAEGPSLLGVLGVNLGIPIQIDVVRSTGTLEAIQCSAATNSRTANISVHSAAGDICIGKLSTNGVCNDAKLVDVDLLGFLGGLSIKNSASITLLGSSSSTLSNPANPQECSFNPGHECLVDMHVDDIKESGPNGLRLGDTVAGLLSSIIGLLDTKHMEVNGLLGVVLYPVLALLGGLNVILTLVVNTVTALLSPILNVLGSALDVLLTGILGIEIGRAEVELISIQCDTAQLVY